MAYCCQSISAISTHLQYNLKSRSKTRYNNYTHIFSAFAKRVYFFCDYYVLLQLLKAFRQKTWDCYRQDASSHPDNQGIKGSV